MGGEIKKPACAGFFVCIIADAYFLAAVSGAAAGAGVAAGAAVAEAGASGAAAGAAAAGAGAAAGVAAAGVSACFSPQAVRARANRAAARAESFIKISLGVKLDILEYFYPVLNETKTKGGAFYHLHS
ncbi:MAG TPA: hypothetical protein VFQ97_05050 [Gallionella sp.]|nr:hypothetical protein [Gallionella sp.]